MEGEGSAKALAGAVKNHDSIKLGGKKADKPLTGKNHPPGRFFAIKII